MISEVSLDLCPTLPTETPMDEVSSPSGLSLNTKGGNLHGPPLRLVIPPTPCNLAEDAASSSSPLEVSPTETLVESAPAYSLKVSPQDESQSFVHPPNFYHSNMPDVSIFYPTSTQFPEPVHPSHNTPTFFPTLQYPQQSIDLYGSEHDFVAQVTVNPSDLELPSASCTVPVLPYNPFPYPPSTETLSPSTPSSASSFPLHCASSLTLVEASDAIMKDDGLLPGPHYWDCGDSRPSPPINGTTYEEFMCALGTGSLPMGFESSTF